MGLISRWSKLRLMMPSFLIWSCNFPHSNSGKTFFIPFFLFSSPHLFVLLNKVMKIVKIYSTKYMDWFEIVSTFMWSVSHFSIFMAIYNVIIEIKKKGASFKAFFNQKYLPPIHMVDDKTWSKKIFFYLFHSRGISLVRFCAFSSSIDKSSII